MITDFHTLYYQDSYQRAFDARVVGMVKLTKDGTSDSSSSAVVLDQSCFYPEGGGQAGDRGYLYLADKKYYVSDTQEADGKIVHLLADDAVLPAGAVVHGEIDFARRFAFMQMHSSEHILSGLVTKRFAYRNVGFHLSEDLMTIDFDGWLDEGELSLLETEVNQIIWQNLPITCTVHEPAEIERLEFRAKKAIPERLRLVRIPDVDACACCGTQLRQTGEIGLFLIIDAMRYKGGIRLSAVAGVNALCYVQELFQSTRRAARALSSPLLQIASAVDQKLERTEKGVMRSRSLMHLLFQQTMPDHFSLAAGSFRLLTGFTAEEAKEYCLNASEHLPGIHLAFIVKPEDQMIQYCAHSATADLSEFAKWLHLQFNGRGGGKKAFIQGVLTTDWKALSQLLSQSMTELPELKLD